MTNPKEPHQELLPDPRQSPEYHRGWRACLEAAGTRSETTLPEDCAVCGIEDCRSGRKGLRPVCAACISVIHGSAGAAPDEYEPPPITSPDDMEGEPAPSEEQREAAQCQHRSGEGYCCLLDTGHVGEHRFWGEEQQVVRGEATAGVAVPGADATGGAPSSVPPPAAAAPPAQSKTLPEPCGSCGLVEHDGAMCRRSLNEWATFFLTERPDVVLPLMSEVWAASYLLARITERMYPHIRPDEPRAPAVNVVPPAGVEPEGVTVFTPDSARDFFRWHNGQPLGDDFAQRTADELNRRIRAALSVTPRDQGGTTK